MAARGVSQDWVVLQRKIFSRWCKQKLIRRHDVKVSDIVEDCKEGVVLYALIEELSESKYPGAVPKQGSVKGRIKQIECINNALKFVWSKGVELKLKPSAEQIADGDEAAVLALVFAIMMKFMKIGDDEESEKLNAKDALLMWCQNKCQGLGDRVPAIESFKKTSKAPFHSGVALCAIIHKHRPALVPLDKQWTVELAQEAALEYFGLEKFVTPAEVAKLDENSMVVYVSEFYYGIMEQRKVDLAARRITKLIKLTIENDRLKAEYNRTAAEYKERLVRVEAVLGDRTIDDTMAGARRRLDEFYKYKTDDKNALLTAQLNLESLFNNLAMRLAHHKRPEFIPPAGVSLKDVEAALLHLEKVEQERSVALHAELNRQVRLVQLNSQHETMFKNFQAWAAEKEAYLRKRVVPESVSAAQLQLRLREAFEVEKTSVREKAVRALKTLGEELKRERYEGMAGVAEREKAVDDALALLDKLSADLLPILQDDLAREEFKQKTRLEFRQHTEKHAAINAWIAESDAYLATREEILSTPEAHTHLSLLDSWEKEKATMLETAVAELKRLGEEIIAAEYKTQYSEWKFEHPEELTSRAAHVDSEWERLAKVAAEKRRVLKDHEAREEVRDSVRLLWQQHADKHDQIQSWADSKAKQLAALPDVRSVAEALVQLGLFASYEKERDSTRRNAVAELADLGKQIKETKYESELSRYCNGFTHTNQPEVDQDEPEFRAAAEEREAAVETRFEELRRLAEHRLAVLNDHLAREKFAHEVRLLDSQHDKLLQKFLEWCNRKAEYLKARPAIDSVSDANTQLSVLAAYDKERVTTEQTSVASIAKLGDEILPKRYKTDLSAWEPENPDEIRGRLATAKEELAKLDEMRNALKADLDAALARELEKERLRLEYAHLTLEFIKFAKDAGANLAIESFGFTLEEVQAYKAEITASRTKLLGDADAQIAQIKAVFKQAEDMGVRENVYTTTTLADVDATRAKLVQAIDTRDAAYEKELARQVANDNLCKEFAGLVDPFSKDIIAQKDAISTSKAELDAQLAYVDKQIAEFLPALAKRLEPIRALAKKMEDAGITNIRHTTLTLRDVEAQERQFGKFLQTKREMLAQEIENAKLRGISPEQFREIETMFATFDKDKSGDIDRKELAACLYSLGEERGAKEIAEIMKEYGDGTKITLPRFREFMIHVFGDSETKQEILLGLELINRHTSVASQKQMSLVLPADDMKYFAESAPKVEGGWDFVAWVESMYSR